MGKKSFNFSGMRDNLSYRAYKTGDFLTETPAGMIITVVGTVGLILGGSIGFVSWAIQPSDEQILAEQRKIQAQELAAQKEEIKEGLITLEQGGTTYELLSENTVRVHEMGLTRDFHFADKHIYVQTQKENDSDIDLAIIDFDDLDNPDNIRNVQSIGCSISTQISAFNTHSGIQPDDIDVVFEIGNGFSEQYCSFPEL